MASTGASAGAPANVVEITSPDMFTSLMQEDLQRVTLLNFWASWAPPCEAMTAAVRESAASYPDVLFMNVEAEEQPDVSESFDVEAVPTVVLLRGHTLLAKLTGGHVAAMQQALQTHAGSSARRALSSSSAAPAAADATYTPKPGAAKALMATAHALPADVDVSQEPASETESRCRTLMTRSPVMLFMKGQPSMPRCGFSQKTVALLKEQAVDFDYYDILSDEPVRQTLKKLNDWPTFPQIIVKGELVGGLDIFKVRGAAHAGTAGVW